ncbi:hypothetical protein DCS_08257 [Drechmeria coniospora]|uniref:Cell wall galactomannoprotein n=1 Tax=Drechmeria coniospora TaxID=98403 RepID=A0A151GGQ2_DRECN|nr:hypothetical protein DCS_08257 [Drechmeria coniospora]KYK56287.1 hypothetical protein DCS_08257 [Drechmeria coniospora]
MKWTNALVFATTASAAAIHGQGVNFDILKQVDTTLQEIITMLNKENPAPTQSINGVFFHSRLTPLADAVRAEAHKIDQLGEAFSEEDGGRLYAPANKFPNLAVALDSALKGNGITAQLAEHGGCDIAGYIFSLQASLIDLSFLSHRILDRISSYAGDAGFDNLRSFTRSLDKTGTMFKGC